MRILVSNDDGIYSPGILSLARVAARFGEVRVVAPDVEQSSASHAVTAAWTRWRASYQARAGTRLTAAGPVMPVPARALPRAPPTGVMWPGRR